MADEAFRRQLVEEYIPVKVEELTEREKLFRVKVMLVTDPERMKDKEEEERRMRAEEERKRLEEEEQIKREEAKIKAIELARQLAIEEAARVKEEEERKRDQFEKEERMRREMELSKLPKMYCGVCRDVVVPGQQYVRYLFNVD